MPFSSQTSVRKKPYTVKETKITIGQKTPNFCIVFESHIDKQYSGLCLDWRLIFRKSEVNYLSQLLTPLIIDEIVYGYKVHDQRIKVLLLCSGTLVSSVHFLSYFCGTTFCSCGLAAMRETNSSFPLDRRSKI